MESLRVEGLLFSSKFKFIHYNKEYNGNINEQSIIRWSEREDR